MQAVRSKDTLIERTFRKALWAKGLRYRKNYSSVYGKPDIAFPSVKVAVFCDSNFWHGRNWEQRKFDIKSNTEFWLNKIQRNIDRDAKVNQVLEEQGWIVVRFWEDEIFDHLQECTQKVFRTVNERRSKSTHRGSNKNYA